MGKHRKRRKPPITRRQAAAGVVVAGVVLGVPDAAFAQTHTVVSGDTLSGIAQKECGNPSEWPVIWDANRAKVGNPNLIYPGQVFTITCTVTPKAAPVQAPPAAVPAVSGTLNCRGLETLWDLAGGNPSDAVMAADIAMAESGGQQYATDHDSNGTTDEGYWQVNTVNGALATYDALGNARSAIILSHDGATWDPWVTYTTGAYARSGC